MLEVYEIERKPRIKNISRNFPYHFTPSLLTLFERAPFIGGNGHDLLGP